MNIRPTLSIAIVSMSCAVLGNAAHGSVVSQMSFEGATSASEVVVIARVTEIPDYGQRHPTMGSIRRNQVKASRYLKGEGASEIVVFTRGAKYIAETPDGPQEFEQFLTGAPQLPPEGTDVVLFLNSWAGGYVIACATHCVVPIQTSADGEQTVSLLFEDPEVMPEHALRLLEEARSQGDPGSRVLVPTAVPIDDLPQLVTKARRVEP